MRTCAGGLLVQGDEMLLAKRSAERAFYPGVWDVRAAGRAARRALTTVSGPG